MRLSWIRIDLHVPNHPKMRKLALISGKNDAWANMVRLWMWFLQYHPDGTFTDPYAISLLEEAADWNGEAGLLIKAALTCGLLSVDGDTYTVHDWLEHTGADVAKARKEADRFKKLRAKKREKAAESTPASRPPVESAPHTVRTPCEHGENKNKNKNKLKSYIKSSKELLSGKPDALPLFIPDARPRNEKAETERQVTEVLTHWRLRAEMPKAAIEGKQAEERRKRIRRWLGNGWSVERLKAVADGLARDDFLMGRDPRCPKPDGYRDVETAYRDQPQMERLERTAEARDAPPVRRDLLPSMAAHVGADAGHAIFAKLAARGIR